MRAVVQRVKKASVRVNHEIISQIGRGVLVLIGIGRNEQEEDIDWMTEKISGLRIFEDEQGKMNLSVMDIGGEILIVSQFTLFGDCRRGKRPSFSEACPPQEAKPIYDRLLKRFEEKGIAVSTGIFQAEMDLDLINWGPVTLLLDSRKNF
ncbi:D-tyrosyl-tRNA(Tyr) deacylase [Syntrophobotulus glycolicus DSM 8271]|uniref:D-aminoacyl-tRNA deacylase n=1 Tax=Syntrophobotulus glycolicus (strain DSM 8271 / FlGlyR) TaxID=645991 RepID=F0T253_SYNGF|nr:D-aminoacyl-tRNA deacylase [Syntrophobotulus glycolicus]ADY56397.1 D-tyrosyl-tRNA(Tyr) deacylase [Syntrophobotulus glycolicus DSM 8271]